MSTDLTTFPGTPVTEYETARPHIRSGDLLLCSGSAWIAKLIQCMTDSPWSHVAFIMRLDKIDRLMVLESVETIGVRTVPLSHYLRDYRGRGSPYPGGIVIARHADFEDNATPDNLKRFGQYAVDRLGYPYDGNEIAKIAARIVSGVVDFPASDRKLLRHDREYICSEYTDVCFGSCGVEFAHDGRGFISPANIARDPRVSLEWVLRRAV